MVPCCRRTARSPRLAPSPICRRKHPTVPVIGSGNEILLPGFINGHHHVGLTPVQLGSPDMPLELWFVTRMVARNLNMYLDTLYSAFEMIASGITTVQHIHGWMPGKLAEVDERARRGDPRVRGYRHAGVVFLRGARPEPAGVSGRRGFRRQPAGRVARADAALVRPVPAFAGRLHRAVREHARSAPEQEPREDPVGAGQSALVLGRGA